METILKLNEQLELGETTSLELVKQSLKTIKKHNERLNALGDLNHHAIFEAKALDLEQSLKGRRSKLHGIPILVKDNILTKGCMRTTVNARTFKNFYAPYDATIIKKLKEAGAIIIAKASLSEFAYYMSKTTMPSGYGSLFKQVVHPYDKTMDPLGSSTGSAVGVAAEYVPLSIGTETNGSLISPANANSIVTIKPTIGLVSRHGIFPVSSLQDTAGPMALNVKDCAIALEIIKGNDEFDITTKMNPQLNENYLKACDKSIKGIKIGLLNYESHEAKGEEKKLQQEAKKLLEAKGAIVKMISHPYDLPDNTKTLSPEFKRDINVFLKTLKCSSPVSNLSELIHDNFVNRRLNLKHGQGRFIEAQGNDLTLLDPSYLEAREQTDAAIDKFLNLYKTHDVECLMTTKITGYAPVGGLPVINVPAKALKDKNPISMLFIGQPFTEALIFSIAHAYEQSTQNKIPPKL